MQNELNITNDKKGIDLLKKYSEEIKGISVDNTRSYTQSREKQFYSHFKLDNRTRYFNTALNDTMTQTMYAYYFCDKSKQVISDKEAAAIKAISIDNNYEMNDDNMGVSSKYYRNNNDDDQFSNLSNSNSNLFASSINERENPHLKRKRKYSSKGMSGSKRGNRKAHKHGGKQNPYEDNDEDNIKAIENRVDNEDDDENKEYCIPDCHMGRKYEEVDMIACDSCNNWFHPKCINMSNEEFKRLQTFSWNCDDCKD